VLQHICLLCRYQHSRHAAAVHLLRAGVDINTIRAWLGHISLDTTNIYAEVDLEMKAKALAQCEIYGTANRHKSWHKVDGVSKGVVARFYADRSRNFSQNLNLFHWKHGLAAVANLCFQSQMREPLVGNRTVLMISLIS
jgi:hypothetical protein